MHSMDRFLTGLIQGKLKNPAMDRFMVFLTRLGNGGLVWLAAGLLLLMVPMYREMSLRLFVALLLCVVLGSGILKPVVGRTRPCQDHPQVPLLIKRPKDDSFPSGHTMSSFAAAVVLTYANPAWGLWAIPMAALIAFSRLYLYVHYPSDILGGMLLGFLVASTVVHF